VREAIRALMDDYRGKFRLVGTEDRDGVTMLEFLGYVAKKRTPPLHFLDRLRQASPNVHHVSFRSLRKMLAEQINADPQPVEPPHDN